MTPELQLSVHFDRAGIGIHPIQHATQVRTSSDGFFDTSTAAAAAAPPAAAAVILGACCRRTNPSILYFLKLPVTAGG